VSRPEKRKPWPLQSAFCLKRGKEKKEDTEGRIYDSLNATRKTEKDEAYYSRIQANSGGERDEFRPSSRMKGKRWRSRPGQGKARESKKKLVLTKNTKKLTGHQRERSPSSNRKEKGGRRLVIKWERRKRRGNVFLDNEKKAGRQEELATSYPINKERIRKGESG